MLSLLSLHTSALSFSTKILCCCYLLCSFFYRNKLTLISFTEEPIPLTTAQKTVVGLKKQKVKKKQNKIIKKLYGSFLGMRFNCFKTRATLRRQFTL